MSHELQNIPALWTAAAHWLAVMFYTALLPKRIQGWPRWLCSGLLLVIMAAFMAVTAPQTGMLFNLLMTGFALLTLLSMALLGKLSVKRIFYYCARAFILGGLACSFGWQMYIYFTQRIAAMEHPLAELAFLLVSYGLVFGLMSVLEKRVRRPEEEIPVPNFAVISTVLIAILIYILSSISFAPFETPFGGSTYAEAFNIRTLVYLGGAAILYANHVQLFESYVALERDTLKNMLNMQYTNYCLSQESVDLVNRKYHDLKHQIAVLRSELGTEQKLEYLDQLEQEIRVYEAQNKTGNQFLDTILSSKSIHCQKEGIKLTCVADGKVLDFMDIIDLSVLFGNALDNAMEAVMKLPDPEQRLIHLSVSQEKGFVRIRLENRCEDDLKVTRDLPVTTKLDSRYHGFGLKSISKTAEKYGGSMTVKAEGGWFELRVLIPFPETAG